MSPYLLSLWDEVIALYLISAKQVFNHTSKDLVLIKIICNYRKTYFL